MSKTNPVANNSVVHLEYLPQLSVPTYFVSTVPESQLTMPKSFVHGKVKPLLGCFEDYNLKAQHNHLTVVHTCPAFAGNG